MQRSLPLVLLFAACASGPAFGPDEVAELRAFQDAVRQVQRTTDEELFTERLLFNLPEGLRLHLLDLHGRTGHGWDGGPEGRGGVIVCFDGSFTLIPWSNGFSYPEHLHGEFARYCTQEDDGTWFLACGGKILRGFDDVLRYTVKGGDGVVLAGVRNGSPCVVCGDRVEEGSLFLPRYRPYLSLDGTRIAYARWHLFGSRPVWAATADPQSSEDLEFPGILEWPPVLSADGSRWAATVQDGSDMAAVENGEVLARFDRLEEPWFSPEGGEFVWKGEAGGKEYVLVGRTLSEPFDSVTWPVFLPDGSWSFLGRDEEGSHLVVDGQRFSGRGEKGYAVRAASGQTLAWQWLGADGIRVSHGDRTFGPYPEQPGLGGLMLSDDGRTVAFRIGMGGPWLVDGERIGADFDRTEEVQLLEGGGCVYVGVELGGPDGPQYWLVMPSGRSGPWDGIGGRKVSADGSRIAFVAWRGREVWRKVLPLR